MIRSGSKAVVFECSMAPPLDVPSMILASRHFPLIEEEHDRFFDTPHVYTPSQRVRILMCGKYV